MSDDPCLRQSPVCTIAPNLDSNKCTALPGLQANTGSDTSSPFVVYERARSLHGEHEIPFRSNASIYQYFKARE